MLRIVRRYSVVAALAVLVPAGVAAQAPGAPGAPGAGQLPAEAQEMIMELQELQSQLQSIQQQAMQDPQIQASGEELGNRIQVAMAEADPATPDRIERLDQLMAEAQQAQAEQNEARMTEIVTEAEALNQQLGAAQAEAIERSDIAPQIADFEAQVEAKMAEVDPEVERLIARLEQLNQELTALLGQD